ncbi:DUF72 domain-containing protein [Sporosarcina thermotolerans]|uniref:DUF72 domain-containing protein n=1 Tax=Sporosarcina thermotolerans TaxID=633404 RepID=A0AAW9A9A5_9BACL|nr:DUF72 domain-containing protein [Sporosarcina thermotolerans]MDW0117575.1 DUF72 domain-containing protein [Sporosarcina thermotolerans]
MIQVGLTGWGDHPDVYSPTSKKSEKLIDYSSHFPIVELDASFYAIQPERNIRKWIDETPDDFQFIVKAYQGMTGHQRGRLPYANPEEMFKQFKLSINPMRASKKLAMILVQFPPWFDCIRENVNQIRYIRTQLEGYDVAIEFRHQSWYVPSMQEKTLDFLKELNFIHSVCDEPQSGIGSIPLVAETTRNDKVLIRLHGRNVNGWRNTTGDNEAWRKVRYLYNYSDSELDEIRQAVNKLKNEAKNVFVVFNNNSGGHAAENAKRFQKMMGIDFQALTPKQLDFFEEE